MVSEIISLKYIEYIQWMIELFYWLPTWWEIKSKKKSQINLNEIRSKKRETSWLFSTLNILVSLNRYNNSHTHSSTFSCHLFCLEKWYFQRYCQSAYQDYSWKLIASSLCFSFVLLFSPPKKCFTRHEQRQLVQVESGDMWLSNRVSSIPELSDTLCSRAKHFLPHCFTTQLTKMSFRAKGRRHLQREIYAETRKLAM